MSTPLTSESLHAAAAQDIEAQVRKDAAGLDPSTIEQIVSLVLRFGPSIYTVLLKLFHITPKA